MQTCTHFSTVPMSITKQNGRVSSSPYMQVIKIAVRNEYDVVTKTIILSTYGVPAMIITKHDDQSVDLQVNQNQDLWQHKTIMRYASRFAGRYLPGYYVDQDLKSNLTRFKPKTFNWSNHDHYFENFEIIDFNPEEKNIDKFK